MIKLTCRGRLQHLDAARNQYGGPGSVQRRVRRRSLPVFLEAPTTVRFSRTPTRRDGLAIRSGIRSGLCTCGLANRSANHCCWRVSSSTLGRGDGHTAATRNKKRQIPRVRCAPCAAQERRAMVNDAAAASDAPVRTWFPAVQPATSLVHRLTAWDRPVRPMPALGAWAWCTQPSRERLTWLSRMWGPVGRVSIRMSVALPALRRSTQRRRRSARDRHRPSARPPS
jgi:hypothetical protein